MRLDELADLHGIDEMHVELHGRLRLALVRVPAGHSHGAVRERHQHPALDDAAPIVVLGRGAERVAEALALAARPERPDEADEPVVRVGLPAGRRGIEIRRHRRRGGLLAIRHQPDPYPFATSH